ncbi:tetraspanin-11-like [Symsagittifera roscoffensis]|uniref:tetraspanin-11-like n=1 Tax=Symsagittifera roscoffensis TaxID=84072 RepID=UPI00307C388B
MAVKYKNARILTFVMAFVCALLGVALFVTSITFLTYPNFIEWYIQITKVEIVCRIAIGLSVLIFVAGAVNLAATFREDLTLIKVSIALMVIAFVLNAICIIVAFVMEFRAQEDVSDQIYAKMRKYGQEEFQMATDTWDFFQKTRQCCGSDGPGDWKFTPFYEDGNQDQLIPRSCCKAYATATPVEPSCQKMSDPSLYYTEGCRSSVNELLWAFIGVIVVVLAICSVCEIVGSISSWMLVKELSKDDEPYEFNPPPTTAPKLNNYSGTLRSQFSGVGSESSHRPRPQPEPPISETGSVRSGRSGRSGPRSEDGRGGFTRNHHNFINQQPKFNQQMSVASRQEGEYQPQLPPPPPPPPVRYSPVPADDNEDFDV